jgi:hypothetical protein
MVLIFAQNQRMNLEVCDAPSAYLNTSLPKEKKHLTRIKPLIANYFVRADNFAKDFLQKDGSSLLASFCSKKHCSMDSPNPANYGTNSSSETTSRQLVIPTSQTTRSSGRRESSLLAFVFMCFRGSCAQTDKLFSAARHRQ